MAQFKVVQVINDGHPMPGWVPEHLEQAGVDLSVAICWSKEDVAQHAGAADVVWAYGGRQLLKGDVLDVVPRCGAILRTGSGTDNIDVKRATELGILVVNTPQAVTDSVSDHAISLLFALVRQVVRHDRLVRRGVWNFREALPSRRYHGAKLGLIGFGRIPRLLVRKLAGFEMDFTAYDPYVHAQDMAQQGVAKGTLDDVLKTSDYVLILCPLTAETTHLIGERELHLMPSHSLLLNMSRGAIVNEPLLIQALQEGWIAGAALDVLEKEPPAPDNPLLAMDNVILTPHYAGYSDDYLTDNYAASVDALIDLSKRRWPYSVVNPQVQPRWADFPPRGKV
jgi:D-3-phosphoglycerate dehydrogenase / 2-oxoglutarate reductase